MKKFLSSPLWLNVSLIVIFISALLLAYRATFPTSSAKKSFNAINLAELEWLVKQGFNESDRFGIQGPTGDKILKVEKFPIVLNKIFNTRYRDRPYHFTASAGFYLEENSRDYNLAIYLAWIGESWRVYLNGKLVQNEMYLKANGHIDTFRTFRGLIIPLNQNHLLTGSNTLTFHIAGYQSPIEQLPNVNAGFLYNEPYVIDTVKNINSYHSELLNIGMNAVFFFFGFFHLLMYLRRYQDNFNLYFGLFAIMLALDGMTKTMIASEIIFDSMVLARIKYMAQALMVPFFVLFVYNYFKSMRKKVSIILEFFKYYSLLLAVLFLTVNHLYVEPLLTVFQISILPMIGFGVILLAREVINRSTDSLAILGSFLIMVAGVLWDIFDDIYFHTGIRLMKFSFFGFVMSLIAIVINRFMRSFKQTEDLNIELTRQKNAFIRFVPDNFLKLLGHQSAVDINLGDNSSDNMSVLVSDIRSFTTMSEKMSAKKVLEFLNEYLAIMEPQIHSNGGFIDKYIGDAILSLFSETSDSEQNSAERAIKSGLAMQTALAAFNQQRLARGEEPVRAGIGINSGPLVIGTVGSKRRLDTTVIGNTVNMASRAESLTSFYKVGFIITDHTYKQLTDPGEYNIREIDIIKVKGKTEPSIIYEVFDNDAEVQRNLKLKHLAEMAEGIDLYRKGKFETALEKFNVLIKKMPQDGPVQLYIDRCRAFIENPPGKDWDAIWELTHK